MPTATITSKGQVTIAVRQAIGLAAGDRVEFVCESKGRYSLVPASQSVKALKGIVPRPQKPVRLEDMEEAIARGAGA